MSLNLRVRLFNADSGELQEILAAAATAPALVQRLEQEGWSVVSQNSEPDASKQGEVSSVFRGKLEIAWWCRELKTLLLAGMTVVEALETLKTQALGAQRQALHDELVSRLREGQALSAAMQSTGKFPMVLIAGVKASERTSTLGAALDDYLQYHELLDGLRRKTASAAIYPSLVFGLGMSITVFLMVYVIPRFSQMYADRSTAVAGSTKILLATSRLFSQHADLLAAATAIALGALIWAWRSGRVMQVCLWLIDAVPVLRKNVHEFRLAKLYQALALMVRGGYAVAESLEQCGQMELGPGLQKRLQAARRELEQGRRVSTALGSVGLTDPVTSRLLTVGERTGNFDQVLQTIAHRHASNFGTFIERTTRVVEPLLLMAVSLLVGGVVVMMYMPIFDIASSIR